MSDTEAGGYFLGTRASSSLKFFHYCEPRTFSYLWKVTRNFVIVHQKSKQKLGGMVLA